VENPGTQDLDRDNCRGEHRADQVREAFIVRLPCIGVAQAANMTGLIDHEEVVDRVTLLLAAVVCLRVLWIGRSVPSCQKGGKEGHPPAVWLRASRLNHQHGALGAALETLRPDSAPYEGDASIYEHSIGTSHRVVRGPLGWGSVSQRSE
jgi:hypothetical protein